MKCNDSVNMILVGVPGGSHRKCLRNCTLLFSGGGKVNLTSRTFANVIPTSLFSCKIERLVELAESTSDKSVLSPLRCCQSLLSNETKRMAQAKTYSAKPFRCMLLYIVMLCRSAVVHALKTFDSAALVALDETCKQGCDRPRQNLSKR